MCKPTFFQVCDRDLCDPSFVVWSGKLDNDRAVGKESGLLFG